MSDSASYLERLKSETEILYRSLKGIICPYFQQEIIFNADGFYHLQVSSGSERNKSEKILKFSLFKYVSQIIQKSGTIQEYRKTMGIIGRKKANGEREMKVIQYWGLVAIIGTQRLRRIKVILREIGTGPITFWSVMPDLKDSASSYKFASEDVEDG